MCSLNHSFGRDFSRPLKEIVVSVFKYIMICGCVFKDTYNRGKCWWRTDLC